MDLKRILSEIHAKAIVGQKDPEKAQAKCGEIVDMIERVFWIPQHEVSEAMAFGLNCRDSRCYF